jgi:hypothetical protein
MHLKTMGVLAAALMLVFAGVGCSRESYTTIAINGDGTVKMTEDFARSRSDVEGASWGPSPVDSADDEDADGPAPTASPVHAEPAPSATDTANGAAPDKGGASAGEKAASVSQAEKDARLEAEIRKALKPSPSENGSEPTYNFKIDSVEVGPEIVRARTTRSYKTLSDFVADSRDVFENTGLSHMTAEKDDAGKLRITLSLPAEAAEITATNLRVTRAQFLGNKFKGSLKFVMPGKVLSSSLPEVRDNETWIEIDAAKPESFDAAAKIVQEKLVIVAEPGPLAMAGFPLDSEKLAAAAAERRLEAAGPPILPAGPGYAAEALGVTTTMIHVFPEGRKFAAERFPSLLRDGAEGCSVEAELFPPRGRTLIDIQNVRALRAVDDVGREVKVPDAGGPGRREAAWGSVKSGGKSAGITLRVGLPVPGAKAFARIEAEAIVSTFAAWKEHPVADLKADPKAAIDLGDLVPGAKIVIVQIKESPRAGYDADPSPYINDGRPAAGRFAINGAVTGTVTFKITGPKAIEQFTFDLKTADGENLRAYNSSSNRFAAGGQSTRTIVTTYEHTSSLAPGAAAGKSKLVLVVRSPDGLKRERVKFTLEAVDLY